MDKDLSNAMTGVPCRAEFYRYVQWHNLAFTVTDDLEVPSHVLHYEDYSTRFDDVTNDLIDFLELERKGDAPDFIVNKEYGEYYTREQKKAIAILVKEFSTTRTWNHLHRYFEDFSTDNDTKTRSKDMLVPNVSHAKKRRVFAVV